MALRRAPRLRGRYSRALVEKFKFMPEIKRIKKHTHLPKRVLKAAAIKETTAGTRAKRERNRRAHSAKGSVPKVARKKKSVWRVDE